MTGPSDSADSRISSDSPHKREIDDQADPPATSSKEADVHFKPPSDSDGSSVEDATPTRTYQGNLPNIQDPTVISKGPILPPPDILGGPSLRLRDIGKALIGQQLNHFSLDEFVGGGGMGAVFRATDTQLERTVAVKILTQRYGGKEETVRRFRVEAQSAARLNHENIATVFFVGEDKGWNFIVFEFIEGENIRDIVAQNGPMDIALALSTTAQVAEALQHASDRDVVHRDIKPSNVLLGPDGRAKLVDMGLARLQQVESSDDDLTVSGVTLGTFDYISPEQGRDPRNADVRSDLYSLGCTLYYMLTGEAPFPDRTVLQKLLSHTSDPAPDPRVLRPETPDDVADLTLRLLAKKPASRYQQPVELIRDIVLAGERNQYSLGVAASVLPQVTANLNPLTRSLPWLLPTLALLVAVFAADAMLGRSGAGTETFPEFRTPDASEPADPTSPLAGSSLNTLSDSSAEAPGEFEALNGFDELGGIGIADSGSAVPSRSLPGSMLTGEDAGSIGEASAGSNLNAIIGEVADDGAAGADGVADESLDPIALPVNASVDIVVAQITELESLKAAAADYQVVTSLPEALAMVAEDPELTHIQLRTNFARLVDPIQITSERLLISAGDGYSPVIRFAPENEPTVSRPAERVGMIDVLGGSLQLEGIHFELDTRSYSRSCALFRVFQPELLSVSDSWIRIVGEPDEIGAYETALVGVEPLGELPGDVDSLATPAPPLELQWRNVVFGGEATVLSVREGRPLRFAWSNGLVATSRAFVELGGVADAPGNADQIKIDFDQVTAVVDQGLCRSVAKAELPHLLTVDMHATRSIIVAPESQPLMMSAGYAQTPEQLETHLLFSGERNFYEGTETFWEKLQQPQPGVEFEMPERIGFDDWQRRLETEERRWYRNKVLWKTSADPNLPRHLTTPSDFSLSDAPNNPARRAGGGVERSDAGFQASQLPSQPAEMR